MALTAVQKSRIDTFLTNIATEIAAKQQQFFDGDEVLVPESIDRDGKPIPAITRRRRRFMQLLATSSVIPTAGAATAPDRLNAKLNDSVERWSDLGLSLPAQLEASVRVDTYENSDGHGWVLTVTVRSGAETWERARNFVGTETSRTHGWEKLEAGQP